MTSGPVVGLELSGPNAVTTWRRLIGPTDPAKARIDDPSTIRARFGKSVTLNCVHGSDSTSAARRELSLVFDKNGGVTKPKLATAGNESVSCLVILPHIVKSGKVGEIVTHVQRAGFDVRGLVMQELTEKQVRV